MGMRLTFKLGLTMKQLLLFFFNFFLIIISLDWKVTLSNYFLQGLTFELFMNNTPWTAVNATGYREETIYSCCPEPYVTVRYHFILKRNSWLYASTTVYPAMSKRR